MIRKKAVLLFFTVLLNSYWSCLCFVKIDCCYCQWSAKHIWIYEEHCFYWAHSGVDKVTGGCVNAWGRSQVWQLVLRAGPYLLTATSMTPCCYISHVDAISKQNNLPLHSKHTQTQATACWLIFQTHLMKALLQSRINMVSFEATQNYSKAGNRALYWYK